jgi:hypothetical protein
MLVREGIAVVSELGQRGIMNERGQRFSAASINSMLNALSTTIKRTN